MKHVLRSYDVIWRCTSYDHDLIEIDNRCRNQSKRQIVSAGKFSTSGILWLRWLFCFEIWCTSFDFSLHWSLKTLIHFYSNDSKKSSILPRILPWRPLVIVGKVENLISSVISLISWFCSEFWIVNFDDPDWYNTFFLSDFYILFLFIQCFLRHTFRKPLELSKIGQQTPSSEEAPGEAPLTILIDRTHFFRAISIFYFFSFNASACTRSGSHWSYRK